MKQRRFALSLRLFLFQLAIGAAVITGIIYFNQDSMIYHPRSYDAGVEAQPGRAMVRLPYQSDGNNQVAFYLPPVNGDAPKRLWLMFGGNGALILQYRDGLPAQPALADDGFLLIDYPGYGFDQGKPSGQAIQAGADRALETLRIHLGISENALLPLAGVVGHSLGTGVALEFAKAHPEVSRIVLIAPFTSLYDMAFRVVGPIASLLHHNYDNAGVLHALGQRTPPPQVVIVTGDQDQVIPVRMSRQLARDNPWLTYHELAGYEHNEIVREAASEIAVAMVAMK